MGVALAGVKNGEVSLIDLRFSIGSMDAEHISLHIDEHRCPGGDCPKGYALVFVGPAELRRRFEREHPNYWLGDVDTIAREAEAYVQMAIDDQIPDVGPPISVLVISKQRVYWRKYGACQAQPDKSAKQPFH